VTRARPSLEDEIERWRGDPVAFAHEHFVIADTRRPIELQPHQQQILRALFTRPYPREAVYSTVKKSGKTAIGALVALYIGMCHAREGTEVIVAANDEEQATSRVFADIKFAVEHDPLFVRSSKDIQTKQITLRNGVVIRAISSDYGSAAGSRHALAVFDELWKYDSERAQRLYDELTAVPNLPFSMRLVVSSAGFDGESTTLKGLYERAMGGARLFEDLPVFRNGRLFAYWDSGEEARRMPWLRGDEGAAYYADQALELRPGQFRRYHLNEWVAGSESFITAAEWDACVNQAATPLLPGEKIAGAVHIGVDIGIRRDASAVVAVERQPDKIRLIAHHVWTPTPQTPVDVESWVEAYLRELLVGFRVRRVWCDPTQFEPVIQRLQREGFSQVEAYPQTDTRLMPMANSLYEVLRSRKIELYPDAAMRQSALQAVALDGRRGWHIGKEKTKHKIDSIVALAMAVHSARTEVPFSYASASVDPHPYFVVPQSRSWRDIGTDRARGLLGALRR
jgi:phage terminase large subunit-like protein